MEGGFRFKCDRWTTTANPNKKLDFSFDWTRWLSYYNPVPTISSFDITITGSATASLIEQFHSNGVVTGIINTGDAEETLKITCNIQIPMGSDVVTDSATIYVSVDENRRPPL